MYDKNFFLLLEEKIENVLTKLPFSKEQVEEIQLYLDGAEYGLSFEALCYIVENNKMPLLKDIYKEIEELGKTMLFDSKTWEGLRSLVMN